MDIRSLSPADRIKLAEQLWDSVLEQPDDIELSPEQIELLESRLAAYKADGDLGDTWENVKARVQDSLK